MPLPQQIVDREYQKFIDAGIDKTAVRVSNIDSEALTVGSSLQDFSVVNITIAAAGIEQSYTFAAGTKRFLIKHRGIGRIQLGAAPTLSATDYLTIWPGAFYRSPEFKPDAKTIYFQSPVVGLVVEIESWS